MPSYPPNRQTGPNNYFSQPMYPNVQQQAYQPMTSFQPSYPSVAGYQQTYQYYQPVVNFQPVQGTFVNNQQNYQQGLPPQGISQQVVANNHGSQPAPQSMQSLSLFNNLLRTFS